MKDSKRLAIMAPIAMPKLLLFVLLLPWMRDISDVFGVTALGWRIVISFLLYVLFSIALFFYTDSISKRFPKLWRSRF